MSAFLIIVSLGKYFIKAFSMRAAKFFSTTDCPFSLFKRTELGNAAVFFLIFFISQF